MFGCLFRQLFSINLFSHFFQVLLLLLFYQILNEILMNSNVASFTLSAAYFEFNFLIQATRNSITSVLRVNSFSLLVNLEPSQEPGRLRRNTLSDPQRHSLHGSCEVRTSSCTDNVIPNRNLYFLVFPS